MADTSKNGQPDQNSSTYPVDPYGPLPGWDDVDLSSSTYRNAPAGADLRDKGSWASAPSLGSQNDASQANTTENASTSASQGAAGLQPAYASAGRHPILEVIHTSNITGAASKSSSRTTPGNATVHGPGGTAPFLHQATEAISYVDKRLSQADVVNNGLRVAAGARAFREYHWLSDVAKTSNSGNLRGMVLSAKCRAAYRFFNPEESRAAWWFETVGLMVGFAASIAEATPELEDIWHSNDPAWFKGTRYAAIAGTAAQRALLGFVPAGTHAVYKALEGWCMLAGLPGGKLEYGANQCLATLNRADTLVQTTFQTVTDTRNQSKAVWWVIDTFLSSRKRK